MNLWLPWGLLSLAEPSSVTVIVTVSVTCATVLNVYCSYAANMICYHSVERSTESAACLLCLLPAMHFALQILRSDRKRAATNPTLSAFQAPVHHHDTCASSPKTPLNALQVATSGPGTEADVNNTFQCCSSRCSSSSKRHCSSTTTTTTAAVTTLVGACRSP